MTVGGQCFLPEWRLSFDYAFLELLTVRALSWNVFQQKQSRSRRGACSLQVCVCPRLGTFRLHRDSSPGSGVVLVLREWHHVTQVDAAILPRTWLRHKFVTCMCNQDFCLLIISLYWKYIEHKIVSNKCSSLQGSFIKLFAFYCEVCVLFFRESSLWPVLVSLPFYSRNLKTSVMEWGLTGVCIQHLQINKKYGCQRRTHTV